MNRIIGIFLTVALLSVIMLPSAVSAQQDEPRSPPVDRTQPSVDAPPVDPPKEPKHPWCDTGTICSTEENFPGSDCWKTEGSIWGGWVKCQHDTYGTISCLIIWPFCYHYGDKGCAIESQQR